MSSNPSWKKSNQSKIFKNVKMDFLDYENGKWKNISTTQTIGSVQKTIKKVVQKLDNQNVIVGIDTNQPYSKLSLGDNEGKTTNISGTNQNIASINTPNANLFMGESTTIALQEKSDGKNLHGFTYLEELNQKNVVTTSTSTNTGIGISTNETSIDVDPNECAVYVDSKNCVTINNIPRNFDNSTLTRGNAGSQVNPQIQLDVKGSLRVDGFLSFIPKFITRTTIPGGNPVYETYIQDADNNSQNNAFSEYLNNPSNYNFPKGAIFVANVNNGTITEPKLFIIDENGDPKDLVGTIKLEDISTTSGATTGGLSTLTWNHGIGSGSSAELRYQFGSASNPCRNILDYRGGSESHVNQNSFTNINFELPDNLLTAIGGNIVILSDSSTILTGTSTSRSNAELKAYNSGSGLRPSDNANRKIENAINDFNKSDTTNNFYFTPSGSGAQRGGNLWVERQITIGPNNSDRLLAMIDIGGQYEGIPGINIGETRVTQATNSIIIGSQERVQDIGDTVDTMNSIIMGKNTKIDINTSVIGGSRNVVYGMSMGSLRVPSLNPFNVPSNATINASPYHHNSIVFGNQNTVRGTQNYVFGQNNVVGELNSATKSSPDNPDDQLVFNTFIAGKNNTIKKDDIDNNDAATSPLKVTDQESFVLMGSNANIDLVEGRVESIFITEGGSGYSFAPNITFARAFGDSTGSGASATATITIPSGSSTGYISGITITNPGSGYTLPPNVIFTTTVGFGSGAEAISILSGSTRFAFGTASKGSVFTIDESGNVRNMGDLTIGGNVNIGNVTLGKDINDNVTIQGSITTSLIPQNDNNIDVGTSTKRFRNLHVDTVSSTLINASNVIRKTDLTKSTGTILTLAESGTTIFQSTNNANLILPATQSGITFSFIWNGLVNGGFSITPNSNDRIMGSIMNSVENKVVSAPNNGGGVDSYKVMLGFGSKVGDRITLIGDGTDGWFVSDGLGSWSFEAEPEPIPEPEPVPEPAPVPEPEPQPQPE